VALSDEVRRLDTKWKSGTGWPLRLESIEIQGIRGWTGQRVAFPFPITAIVGENGVGKSTVLQCAAAVYKAPASAKDRFASDFFPDTAWEKLEGVELRASLREGETQSTATIRKPGPRWRGNPKRRVRPVEYVDLSRVQPVPARLGYQRLANPGHSEVGASPFAADRLGRLSAILGRSYDLAKMALTNVDKKREVPVLAYHGDSYSGFHQGAGETTVTELLQTDFPRHSLVLIDEIESSLHPRAQRRLIRDLATAARQLELQVVLTTHSPYVLEEVPPEARVCIIQTPSDDREIVYGVSPEFAMTKMDDVQHAECDLYVEDMAAKIMLTEILIKANPDLVQRCEIVPIGAASVGRALGEMVNSHRFPRPSRVFLDGDQPVSVGCAILPGEDAPERVVFAALNERGWNGVALRTGREYARVADACERAMATPDHHQWTTLTASPLFLTTGNLWQAMCAEWTNCCLGQSEAAAVAQIVEDALAGVSLKVTAKVSVPVLSPPPAQAPASRAVPQQLSLQ
jgi:predicted ATPase